MINLEARIITSDKNMGDLIDMTSVYNNLPTYLPTNNWNYYMRRNMQEIIPGVYLGPYSTALRNCRSALLDKGITHIICVRQDIEAHYIKPQFSDSTFTYLTLEFADTVTESIIKYFPKVRQFIDDALAHNAKVLVHGNNGNSRSAALVLAYIMEKFGLTYREAYAYAKDRRACIKPNDGFISQLEEYEPIYRARQSLEQGGTSCETRRHKRKCDELSELVDIDLIQPPPSPATELVGVDYRQEEVLDISNHLHRLWLLKTA
ncbi:serine/threonine/tyrosine-interacting protein-like [Onthophagus taurus]|uniref:serine/threonine/tyrosine-interacting protein-like n=1 Tax=Onthophagus taurus TaxID=166361 RepID=UPI000C20BE40|nr:serine/threonine/tyrosine-interacting protein-like [Onthophagus taurus]XP_022918670.1 serine/threonine/tyrosine-interacting protein-like [Onthophagus taurus]